MGNLSLLQGNLPDPGIKLGSLALQADFLPAELPGKPKNTGVGKPIPSPEELPDPGIKLGSPALQADSLPAELPGKIFNTYEQTTLNDIILIASSF